MKKISNKNLKFVSLRGFEGINVPHAHSADGCLDVVNFRITSDGSLEKREGFRQLCDLEEPIQAIWSGQKGNKNVCYALAADDVFEIDKETGAASVLCSIDSDCSNAEFFSYCGEVYLLNGVSLYLISEGDATTPFGYVPLIGKDWSDNEIGDIYEPRNLLNSCGRIRYKISENATSILRLDAPISIVNGLYINGERVSSSRYTVSSAPPALNVSGLNAGDVVDFYFTYADTPYSTSALFSNTHVQVFGGIHNSRPFLWGGSNPSVIWCGAYVSQNELKEAQVVFPESDALYFPVGYEFTVGDGSFPISTVSRHYDRLLVFTEGGAWMADSSACGTEDFPIMNINSSVGVSATSSDTLGNLPCTVGKSGIYLWNSDTDEHNECNAFRISDPILPLLEPSFFDSPVVFADNVKNELLFSYPNDEGILWIYNKDKNAWIRFTGIGAERIFSLNDTVAFTKDTAIFIFDENATTDCGAEIKSSFTSGIIDFGNDCKKHMSSLSVCFDGELLDATITLDSDEERPCSISLAKSGGHGIVTKRVSSRRFFHASLTLKCGGETREKIHRVKLAAR